MNKPETNFKYKPFNKMENLKLRWGDTTIDAKQLKAYNDWSQKRRYETITIELRIEHYLCHNIEVDLKNHNDLFINLDKYFNNKWKHNNHFKKVLKNLKKHAGKSQVRISHIRLLTFGQKLLIWNFLKKNIFKHKFSGVPKNKQKMLVIALRNVKEMRNGIAHMNSEKQIYSNMRIIGTNIEQEKRYRKSYAIANRMQEKLPQGEKDE